MSKQPPRRPQVFNADDPLVRPSQGATRRAKAEAAAGSSRPEMSAPETDPTENEEPATGSAAPEPAEPPAQTMAPPERPAPFGFMSAFISAVLALSSLAIGLWFSRFVSIAVARDDWLGWPLL